MRRYNHFKKSNLFIICVEKYRINLYIFFKLLHLQILYIDYIVYIDHSFENKLFFYICIILYNLTTVKYFYDINFSLAEILQFQ